MMLEIIDKVSNYSCVVSIHEKYVKYFKNTLPFSTKLNVWKEEVYLNTPVKIPSNELVPAYKVRLGRLYYWPPEQSLCLFYGASEAYTPVSEVGTVVGPLYYLRYFSSGDEAEVRVHELSPQLSRLAKYVGSLGYLVASVVNGDVTALAATKFLGGDCRSSFLVFSEDFGYHLESDAFFRLSESLNDRVLFSSLKSYVNSLTKYLRLDINEDGYAVLTAGVGTLNELLESINELEVILPLLKERFGIYF